MKSIVKGSREYWERDWNTKTSSRPKKESQKQMILNALKFLNIQDLYAIALSIFFNVTCLFMYKSIMWILKCY